MSRQVAASFASAPVAFNLAATAGGKNAGWLVAAGTPDRKTGKAAMVPQDRGAWVATSVTSLDRRVRIGLSYWPVGAGVLFRPRLGRRSTRSAHAVTRHFRPLRGPCLGLGALECVLPRCARRRARSASAGLGLPVRRRAAQFAWARLSPGRGGAAS